jgi:cell division cycle 20-like protein 1 (cofactor of APC complex)
MDHPTVQRLPSESSELNLTPTRPDEEPARLRHIERLFNPNHSRAPSRILSDRFIPSRTGSNFALFHLSPERPQDTDYSRRIRRALFPPPTPENGSDLINPPNRNIFRYQTVTRRPLNSVSLPESYDDNAVVNHSAVNVPRKIPKSPYKVYS